MLPDFRAQFHVELSVDFLSRHERTSAAWSPAPIEDATNDVNKNVLNVALPESFHDDVTACCEQIPIDSVFCSVPVTLFHSFTMLAKVFLAAGFDGK